MHSCQVSRFLPFYVLVCLILQHCPGIQLDCTNGGAAQT